MLARRPKCGREPALAVALALLPGALVRDAVRALQAALALALPEHEAALVPANGAGRWGGLRLVECSDCRRRVHNRRFRTFYTRAPLEKDVL